MKGLLFGVQLSGRGDNEEYSAHDSRESRSFERRGFVYYYKSRGWNTCSLHGGMVGVHVGFVAVWLEYM